MLLESLTKHPSRSTADHISKSISISIYKITSFWRVEIRPGYDKAPCKDSMGKGCAEEDETKHVHCQKLNKRNFVLPV